jgi:hypothetical protein
MPNTIPDCAASAAGLRLLLAWRSAWQQTLDIPGAKDLMLNQAYKAMAWQGEAIEGEDSGQARHCTDAIEEALYERRKSLFGAISVPSSTPPRFISRATVAPHSANEVIPRTSARSSVA